MKYVVYTTPAGSDTRWYRTRQNNATGQLEKARRFATQADAERHVEYLRTMVNGSTVVGIEPVEG